MYVFYINGSHIEKRFGKEFINYICGGKIRHDIKSEDCTRKRLVVKSRYAANKLLDANGQCYWPDGTRFRCKLIKRKQDADYRKKECCKYFRSTPSPMPPPQIEDDWYNSATFVDVNLDEDDHVYESNSCMI
ncbi:lef-6 [Alphabaculovirus alterspexiguae]|uniref:Lef-6 n=1 Tax=Spodoptera exigua multiple nucleopolyhedrovirus TaxID=10454 RepID=A0A3G2JU57_9ABAC|nr:lef-6 [Spodoptera exigua multiple nucleopolyhedrovirus]AYN45075.1 lef-6 [Spodoptera exigua multiple nucleopolyhedrovirus]